MKTIDPENRNFYKLKDVQLNYVIGGGSSKVVGTCPRCGKRGPGFPPACFYVRGVGRRDQSNIRVNTGDGVGGDGSS